MENAQAMVYSEVYEILDMLGDSYIKLIPIKLYNFIKENRSTEYSPILDNNISLAMQNISKNATALICMLHYNYWCTTEEEKENLNKVLDYNQNKKQETLSNYNEEIFNKNKNEVRQNEYTKDIKENANEQVALVVKNETFFTKIIKFFKRIFKK